MVQLTKVHSRIILETRHFFKWSFTDVYIIDNCVFDIYAQKVCIELDYSFTCDLRCPQIFRVSMLFVYIMKSCQFTQLMIAKEIIIFDCHHVPNTFWHYLWVVIELNWLTSSKTTDSLPIWRWLLTIKRRLLCERDENWWKWFVSTEKRNGLIRVIVDLFHWRNLALLE